MATPAARATQVPKEAATAVQRARREAAQSHCIGPERDSFRKERSRNSGNFVSDTEEPQLTQG